MLYLTARRRRCLSCSEKHILKSMTRPQSVMLANPYLPYLISAQRILLSRLVIPKHDSIDNSYVVAGVYNKIHIGEPGKGSAIKCDSVCPNKSTGICEHVIAVTEKRRVFLEYYNKTGRGANLTSISLQSGPVSAGKTCSQMHMLTGYRLLHQLQAVHLHLMQETNIQDQLNR